MIRTLSILFIWLMYSQMWSQSPTELYISSYQDIAISEMMTSGIPASITLAQGLLESNHGRSRLSTEANNHFGIKCGNTWAGPTINVEDDDYDQDGKLTESCFRSFASAEASYRAHSAFLLNPKKEYRYGHLFSIGPHDYHAWAMGLQNSGYATDTGYGQKLIKLIETYRLYQYDQAYASQEPTNVITASKDKMHASANSHTSVLTASGTTIDLLDSETQYVHIVEKGDDMDLIATKYQINLEKLYHYNRLPPRSQPIVGEEINLNTYHHWGKRPKFVSHTDITKKSEDEILFESPKFAVESRQ